MRGMLLSVIITSRRIMVISLLLKNHFSEKHEGRIKGKCWPMWVREITFFILREAGLVAECHYTAAVHVVKKPSVISKAL
jgi:hypothetical protein